MTRTEYLSNLEKKEPFHITSQVKIYPKPTLFDPEAYEVGVSIGSANYTKELSKPKDFKRTLTEICIFIENCYTKQEYTLKRIIMRDINSWILLIL